MLVWYGWLYGGGGKREVKVAMFDLLYLSYVKLQRKERKERRDHTYLGTLVP